MVEYFAKEFMFVPIWVEKRQLRYGEPLFVGQFFEAFGQCQLRQGFFRCLVGLDAPSLQGVITDKQLEHGNSVSSDSICVSVGIHGSATVGKGKVKEKRCGCEKGVRESERLSAFFCFCAS